MYFRVPAIITRRIGKYGKLLIKRGTIARIDVLAVGKQSLNLRLRRVVALARKTN